MTTNFYKTLYYLIIFLTFMAMDALGQASTTVSGKVTKASTGEALIGVNILVKGKIIGTITDLDGTFKLQINEAPPHTLVFSSVGYEKKESPLPRPQHRI